MRCDVVGCGSEDRKGFYSFPSNKQTSWKWIKATKTFHLIYRWSKNKLAHSFYKVCGKHFRESDFKKNVKGQKCLKENVVPTLFLPGPLTLKSEHSYTLVDAVLLYKSSD